MKKSVESKNIAQIHAEVSLSDFVGYFYMKFCNTNLRGSILDEKSGLRSHEQGNRTDSSLTKRVASLPDLSLKDKRATTF